MDRNEKVTEAAIRLDDGRVFYGKRHAHIMAKIWEETPNMFIRMDMQGFRTSLRPFVDRRIAAVIAFVIGLECCQLVEWVV